MLKIYFLCLDTNEPFDNDSGFQVCSIFYIIVSVVMAICNEKVGRDLRIERRKTVEKVSKSKENVLTKEKDGKKESKLTSEIRPKRY
jgi:hypothetical protein